MNKEERNQDTLPTLATIADTLKLMRQELAAGFQMMGERTDHLENRVGQLENRMMLVEATVEEVRVQVVGVNVGLERLGAVMQNNRADTIVLQEEVHAWARDVQVLQRKVETLAG
jgi:chromosome segregation ATPase